MVEDSEPVSQPSQITAVLTTEVVTQNVMILPEETFGTMHSLLAVDGLTGSLILET